MNFRSLSLAIAAALLVSPAAFAQDADAASGGTVTTTDATTTPSDHKRFSVAGTYNIVKPKGDAFSDDPKRGLKGGSMPAVSAAWHVTDNIAVEAWGAVDKSEHKIVGPGVGGQVKAQPYGVSGQYHFGQSGQAIRPYVGLGYYEANISDEKDAAGQHIGMSTPKGAMGTVGADFNINERWFTRAEARYLKGKSDVTRGGQKVGEAQLDPWVVGVGMGARF